MSELPVPPRLIVFPFPSDTIPTALSPVITILPLFVITPFEVETNPVPATSFVFPYNPIEPFPATVIVPLLVTSKTLLLPKVPVVIRLSVP